MKNYSILAKYYDKFTEQDCDYESWSQYLCAVAQKFKVKTIADIACGTGKMTQLLARHGYAVTGIDQSREMLAEASQKCRATFVLQDMKKLQLPRPMDMAVIVNDGVNYLNGSELVPFFTNLAANLRDGAPLVFDVSTPYKLQNVLGNNVFFVDDDEATLLWSNKTHADKTVLSLTLFEKNGEHYKRFDEQHLQYAHTFETLTSALVQAGFQLVEITAEYGKKLTNTALRATYFATKTKRN